MASVTALYTPAILGLATSLVAYPLDLRWPLQGHARSPSCGSSLHISMELDAAGRIAEIGVAAQACAIGQAATALMLAAAKGRQRAEFEQIDVALQKWLSDCAPAPDWPELNLLEPARAFAGRHGAILLPWRAVLSAFASADAA